MRRCTICTSEGRQDIEEAVRAGEPYRVVAEKYRVSYSALQRHVSTHMAAEDTVQQAVKLKLEDVTNLPVDMAERRVRINELLDTCLEPLMRPRGRLDDVPLSVVIRLLTLQQKDQLTILRIIGLTQDSNEAKKVSDVNTGVRPETDDRIYDRIMGNFDTILKDDPETRPQSADRPTEADREGR